MAVRPGVIISVLLVLAPSGAADLPGPDAPTGLEAERLDGQALLTWEGVEGALLYNVYEAGQLIGATETLSFVAVDPPEVAAYTVTAVAESESPPSAPAFLGPSCLDVGPPPPYVWVNVEACLES